jgi:thiol-disulfide isomerase/thioredoxin
MKNIARTAIVVGLVWTVTSYGYDNLADLTKDMQVKQAAALKEYVAAHPDAEDIDAAGEMLMRSLMQAGDNEEALKLLLAKYDRAAKQGAEAELPDVYRGILSPTVEIYQELGRKDEGLAFLKRATKDFAEHEEFEQFERALKGLEGQFNQPAVGETMEIKGATLDGKDYDLSALKGKVVLVDFWATWCGPCRAEMPNVKKAYQQHHADGFEIIGISLDDNIEKAKKYVADNSIAWPQIADGKGWQAELAQKYGINSIPATFLVGKDGKIAATDMRGELLAAKVAELLKAE